jgi:hypothetical protein
LRILAWYDESRKRFSHCANETTQQVNQSNQQSVEAQNDEWRQERIKYELEEWILDELKVRGQRLQEWIVLNNLNEGSGSREEDQDHNQSEPH